MILRIVLASLSLATLAACSAADRDAPVNIAGVDASCSAISSTGDMYRYCLQVGPDQALLEVEGTGTGTSKAAFALTAARRR